MGSRSRSGHCNAALRYATEARIAALLRQIERRRKEVRKLRARLAWEKANERCRAGNR